MHHDRDLSQLAAQTPQIYQRNAARFDRERSRVLFEQVWLDRFAALLPARATVLDAGCGAGEPIARYLFDQGLHVTGIDASSQMIAIAATRLPAATWRVTDMRDLALAEQFDGIVSWHAFFHLTPAQQRTTLARFAQHLVAPGALLLTVGPQAGETVGSVGGEAVYHSSLSPTEYRRILTELGLTVVDFVLEDASCDYASVLLARKQVAAAPR